ncbi:MAG: hypothetical protein ABSD21_13155 [Rhizomicrobium sp.]|jgi:hypothetical protein
MRKMLAYLVIVALALSASGCALFSKPRIIKWSKPNATYQMYAQDRYTCLQQARTPVSGAYVYGNMGSSSSGYAESASLLMACMAAHGWA